MHKEIIREIPFKITVKFLIYMDIYLLRYTQNLEYNYKII